MVHHKAPQCAAITIALIAGFSSMASGQFERPCYSARSCAVTSVFRVNASQVEAGLPDTPLLKWLQQTAGPSADVTTGIWENSWGTCEDVPADANPPVEPTVPWRVCAQAAAVLGDGRVVSIALAAQMIGATPQSVQFGNAYIVNSRYRYDSLDVRTLRELPAALEIPVERWPHAELSVTAEDVRLEPANPGPGAPAEAIVTVRNKGADLARVRILLAQRSECSESSEPLATKEGRIPPGESLIWRQKFTAPPGPRWWLNVRADLLSVARYIRKYESSPEPKEISKPVGPGPFKNCVGGN
jgi:hypothetical protein